MIKQGQSKTLLGYHRDRISGGGMEKKRGCTVSVIKT